MTCPASPSAIEVVDPHLRPIERQYLHAKFGASTPLRAIARNAGIFTLWHLVVTLRTIGDTTLARQPLLLAGAYLSSLGTIFAGGVVFAFVRQRTGSCAYSALAHWLADGLLTLGARML
jgi:membrane protease YdiL (CAAX protease family)